VRTATSLRVPPPPRVRHLTPHALVQEGDEPEEGDEGEDEGEDGAVTPFLAHRGTPWRRVLTTHTGCLVSCLSEEEEEEVPVRVLARVCSPTALGLTERVAQSRKRTATKKAVEAELDDEDEDEDEEEVRARFV
jgi:hypothetical protein